MAPTTKGRPVGVSQADVATTQDCRRVDSDDVNALRAELMLIARLWLRVYAAASMDFGRPTLERNHFRKFTTQSTHSSVEIPSRSNSGSRFAGIAPRLSHFIIRPYCHDITPTAYNTVKMVTHHSVAHNFNAHNPRQKFHPLPNEFPSVLTICTGQRILSAEISCPALISQPGMNDVDSSTARQKAAMRFAACSRSDSATSSTGLCM